jgi:hypothetical protein
MGYGLVAGVAGGGLGTPEERKKTETLIFF